MNIAGYENSVRGCWLGKNVGGTLGTPFEGNRDLHNVEFYVQKDLAGNPEPNDDLDLQLIWLAMAEYYGLDNLTSRMFGEYWVDCICGPWNEYSVCRWNCMNGFYPPMSGIVNNDVWKWSNGAWIRSEIWACLFPGNPDKAVEYAYLDASCDHEGEGIYAEMFTASLESAAFVVKDLRKLIEIGLAHVPVNSRIHKSVEFVCKCYDEGKSWEEARNGVVELSSDIGWFQAPANVSFAVIGLLYGEGDFGKAICTACNCGDDTDCTAATAGAIMGIILGADNIPAKWTEPIGDMIATKSFNRFSMPQPIPATITELTKRVIVVAERYEQDYPTLETPALTSTAVAEKIWKLTPYRMNYNVGHGNIEVEYPDTALIEPGHEYRLRFGYCSTFTSQTEVRYKLMLPEGWKSSMPEVSNETNIFCRPYVETTVKVPDELDSIMYYLNVQVVTDSRRCPVIITLPFCRKGAVSYQKIDGAVLDDSHKRFVAMRERGRR